MSFSIQRSLFGFGYDSRALRSREEDDSQEIILPVGGLHAGLPAHLLPAGYTPDARNVYTQDGSITPRSGLSQFGGGDTGLGGPALGVVRAFDLVGGEHAIAASEDTLSFLNVANPSWSTLSYIGSDAPSGTSIDPWEGTWVYDPLSDQNMVVLTNHVNLPKVAFLQDSVVTYSDLTECASLLSTARSVTAFDSRLVWFNTSSSGVTFPQRVLWSVRGGPRDYDLADGAGFEDLMDMKGRGMRVVSDREGILLFSEQEVWRGRKRYDSFVFDFYAISREVGCPYPATVAQTPMGTIFLGGDLESYLVTGDTVQPIGPQSAGTPSRVRNYLRSDGGQFERAWAIYNVALRRYELYFPGAESEEGFATRALFYSLEDGSWFPQRFEWEMSAGFEMRDPGEAGPSWDALDLTWDEMLEAWDDTDTPGAGRNVCPISSNGTSYRFDGGQTTDDGTEIDVRWQSHSFGGGRFGFRRLLEVWFDYSNPSDSTAEVYGITAPGASVGETRTPVLFGATGFGQAMATMDVTGAAPSFELRMNAEGRPQISRMAARVRNSGRFGGAV